MLRKKPGIAPPIGSGALSRDLRERVSAEERRFLVGLSLLANFRGHTRPAADGTPTAEHHVHRSSNPLNNPSIMMCVELRIRCSQPPSRGISGSLATFAEPYGRGPEMRH
jgi:hypothetical protein